MPQRKIDLAHMRHLGNRVAMARKAYGQSQVKLGQLLGIKSTDVSLIECGKSVQLLEENLDAICKVFSISEDWLYEGLAVRPQLHMEERLMRLEYKIDLILHHLQLQKQPPKEPGQGHQPIAHPGSAQQPLPPTSR